MQPTMMKSAMQNGLIMGVIFSINFLLSISGNPALRILSNITPIIILNILYMMSVKYRTNECNNSITYGKALLYIVLIFFYAALISTIVKFVYCNYINTEYLSNIYQEVMKTMEALKFPLVKNEADQIETMLKPINFLLAYIWSNVFLGTLVGLIMAAFIKKEKSIFEA